ARELGPDDPLFQATVGGLGLTGLITWAEIALRRIPVAAVRMEAIPFAGVEEFLALSEESDAEFEYTVAWVDVLSRAHRGLFFPLDGVAHWNRLYGRRGLLQFQCVVPAPEALRALLSEAPPSPLTVLKRFGPARSPGMLSFPRPGFTLALDLPNRGEETFAQL